MTTFLNTDLDVVSDRDPTPLVAALEREGNVHQLTPAPIANDDGTWFVNFETFVRPHTAEATAASIVDAIENLDADERALWDACRSRVLDLGFDAGKGDVLAMTLSPRTVARAAAAGLAITVTIYPVDMPVRSVEAGEVP